MPGAPASDDALTVRDHHVASDGGTLFARSWTPAVADAPRRAAILLFHDSLGCVALWRDFPARLAAATGRTVVAYDRLGFGHSDPCPGTLPFTFVRDEAERVVPRLLAQLGLERVVPFGHSVGGGMAVATAAALGDACDGLVTVAAQSFVEDRTLAGVRAAREAFREPDRVGRLARHHGAKAPWVLAAWIDTWLDPAFATWNLDGHLREVRCPTLALHGNRDEYGSVAHPARIDRLVPAASRAVILDDCGHVPQREQPERVLAEVAQFLRT